MWIAFAFGSALFAGLTAILAKSGIKNTDSNVATAFSYIVFKEKLNRNAGLQPIWYLGAIDMAYEKKDGILTVNSWKELKNLMDSKL